MYVIWVLYEPVETLVLMQAPYQIVVLTAGLAATELLATVAEVWLLAGTAANPVAGIEILD